MSYYRIIRRNASSLWTPSELGSLKGWWDADDSATLFDATSGGSTPSADGTVARWEDKSGSGFHMTQSTSGSRPTYRTGAQNGRAMLDFDGDDLLIDSDPTLWQITNLTVLVVFKDDVESGFAGIFCMAPSSGADHTNLSGFAIHTHTSSYDMMFEHNSTYTGIGNGQGGGLAPIGIYVARKEGTALATWRNGSAGGSATASGTAGTPVKLYAGGRQEGSIPGGNFNGRIAEILLFDTALSPADRQTLEGYLAHKWGLSANLPTGHPYKDNAP